MVLDAERCYQAMASRDRRFDGQFLVGVLTTGVYCRPGCPAPIPKPDNVRFFVCAAAAEDAGLRPCKRCRPDAAPGSPAWMGTPATVSRALRLIAQGGLDEDPVGALASRLGVGERHLRRLFDQHLGASPSAIAITQRLHFARKLLEETALPISEIAYASGFASIRRFNDAVRSSFQASPSELRKSSKTASRSGSRSIVSLRLPYRAPFDWEDLLAFLRPRAIPGVEEVSGDTWRRTACIGDEPAIVQVSPDSSGQHLVLTAPSTEPRDLSALVLRARGLFDLDANPVGIEEHLSSDPLLRKVIRRRPGLRVPGAWDGFELAVRAVLGQQVSVKAATTLSGRIAATFGREVAGKGLTRLFPDAAALEHADLESVGLTGERARCIRAIARRALDGNLFCAKGDLADQVEHWTSLPGVGPWTAHYVLMRAGREPDAFPSGDLGLRKAVSVSGQPASQRELDKRAESWRPWRAYAAMHLWMMDRKG